MILALILERIQSRTFTFKGILGDLITTFDKCSYDIYLAHTTCLNLFATLRDMYNLNTGVVAVGSALSTVVLTVALYMIVERPFGKKKDIIMKVGK